MKINLVAVGGTIGSRIEGGEPVISDAATEQIASVLDAQKVYGRFHMHSANAGFAELNKLRETVQKATIDADGVVITHGTDTLAYSATYLAFSFASTEIPIVLCAADMPLTSDDSNGYDVLRAAKSFIARGERGVFVVYKNPGEVVRIHHGARLIPAHMHENFYFSLGGSTVFKDTGAMRGMSFELENSGLLCISPYVGMDYSLYKTDNLSAILHSAFHSGKMNIAALNGFAQANKDVPVFFLTGSKKYSRDEFAKNIVLCPNTTRTALYFKLLIGLKNKVKDLPAFVLKNVCGEIVEK